MSSCDPIYKVRFVMRTAKSEVLRYGLCLAVLCLGGMTVYLSMRSGAFHFGLDTVSVDIVDNKRAGDLMDSGNAVLIETGSDVMLQDRVARVIYWNPDEPLPTGIAIDRDIIVHCT